MKKFKNLVTLLVIFCMLFAITACSEKIENTENTEVSTKTDETQLNKWKISTEEITVNLGDEFQINYSSNTEERPIWNQYEWGNIIKYIGTEWDPEKGVVWKDEYGVATFKAVSEGTVYLTVYSTDSPGSNICKINVIES